VKREMVLATRSAIPIVQAMNSNQQPPAAGQAAHTPPAKKLPVSGPHGAFTDEDAAFIVTACNAYEANQATIAKQQATIKALTEVLSELVCRFDFLSDKETSGVPVHWREIAANGSIAKARAVLAQAKEGQQ